MPVGNDNQRDSKIPKLRIFGDNDLVGVIKKEAVNECQVKTNASERKESTIELCKDLGIDLNTK